MWATKHDHLVVWHRSNKEQQGFCSMLVIAFLGTANRCTAKGIICGTLLSLNATWPAITHHTAVQISYLAELLVFYTGALGQ